MITLNNYNSLNNKSRFLEKSNLPVEKKLNQCIEDFFFQNI